MLSAKAKLFKRFVIPGAVLAAAIAAVGLTAPALESWRDLAPLRHGHIAYIKWPCTRAGATCPAYRLDVFGDGTVIYRSLGGTRVEGDYIYRVPDDEIREYMRDLAVSAFWQNKIASGPDVNGGSCVILLHLNEETLRNGCLKWQPGSDQALNDPGVSDTVAQLEALSRVNSLAVGDASTAEVVRAARPYTAGK